MPDATIVIPCYNERERLDPAQVLELAARMRVLLVDDGSTDDTRGLHESLASESPRIGALALDRNRGKAEAVRRGLLAAIDGGAPVVGYADADFSTPAPELTRLLRVLEAETAHQGVIASRVALAGRRIHRDARRHYFGRVFATAASVVLGAVIYDTQCGAKFFRASEPLRLALAEPFLSRWAFDVELIGRLAVQGAHVIEEPLHEWIHVEGSKLSASAMVRTGLELVAIRRDLQRRKAS